MKKLLFSLILSLLPIASSAIQYEYFNPLMKSNAAVKVNETVGVLTPPEGKGFGVLSALTNLQSVNSSITTDEYGIQVDTLGLVCPTEEAVVAAISDHNSSETAHSFIQNKVTVNTAAIDANADAIQKTREDFIAADSEIHQILNSHAGELTTLRNDVDDLGDEVAVIEGKIPASTTSSNQLVNASQLAAEEQDIRADMNETDSQLQTQITAQAGAISTLQDDVGDLFADKLDKNQGSENANKILTVGADGQITVSSAPGSGLLSVSHDATLTGAGTDASPLGVSSSVLSEYVSKTTSAAQTIVSSLQMPELTVGTSEGTLNLSITAGVATIATNNGLDIISQTKFDTSPTTDDTTTWANALDASLVNKAQVASAIEEIPTGANLPILTHMWADHILNDISWLRADTFSWQSGDVYVAAYEHLVADYENAESETLYAWGNNLSIYFYTLSESPSVGDSVYTSSGSLYSSVYVTEVADGGIYVGGDNTKSTLYRRDSSRDTEIPQTDTIGDITITYYLADDGHKICLPDQESNIVALYESTGVAWYYILDTQNKRFKLPRTKYGFVGMRDGVSNYVPESLPNIKGSADFAYGTLWGTTFSGALYNDLGNHGTRAQGEGGSSPRSIKIDASLSSSTYQDGAPVQQRATQMYLYFFVGNFEQSAIEQTAGINAELFNQKMDNGTPLARDIFSPEEWENESMEQILSAGAGSGTLTFSKNWQEYDYLWFSSVSDASNTLDDSPHWVNVKWMLEQAKAGVTNLAVVRYASGGYWYVNPQTWTETTMPVGSASEGLYINRVYAIKLKNITAQNVGLLNYKGLFETAAALVATVPTAMGQWAIVSNDETQGGLQTKYFSTKDVNGNFVWAFGGVIDSSLTGADYVVESQIPTEANGYTWYRKYKSGWVEQGGKYLNQAASGSNTVSLLIPMADTNYSLITQRIKPNTSAETGNDITPRLYNATTTSFGADLRVTNGNTSTTVSDWCWQVSGMAAQ